MELASSHIASRTEVDSKGRLAGRTDLDDGREIAVEGSLAWVNLLGIHNSRADRNDGHRKCGTEDKYRIADHSARDRTSRRLCRLCMKCGCHGSANEDADADGSCGQVQPGNPLADWDCGAVDFGYEAIARTDDEVRCMIRAAHLAIVDSGSLVAPYLHGQLVVCSTDVSRWEVAKGGSNHVCDLSPAKADENSRGMPCLISAYPPPRELALAQCHHDSGNLLIETVFDLMRCSQQVGAD